MTSTVKNKQSAQAELLGQDDGSDGLHRVWMTSSRPGFPEQSCSPRAVEPMSSKRIQPMPSEKVTDKTTRKLLGNQYQRYRVGADGVLQSAPEVSSFALPYWFSMVQYSAVI